MDKFSYVNRFLLIVIGVVVWVSIFLSTDFMVPFLSSIIEKTVVPVGGFSSINMMIYGVLMPLFSNLLVLFMMFFGLIRLHNYMCATLHDDAFSRIEENVSTKHLTSKLSLGYGIFK